MPLWMEYDNKFVVVNNKFTNDVENGLDMYGVRRIL